MQIDDVAGAISTFDFLTYFEGHTRASGWFADRSGKPLRHFCGDFVGTLDGGVLVLDKVLYYTDKVVEKRLWRVAVDEGGRFSAASESLVDGARGMIRGNTLEIRYVMRMPTADGGSSTFKFHDFMMLQPDGSLHNLTHVKKWGVRLGTVSTQYDRHDGSKTCATRSALVARRHWERPLAAF